MCKKSKAFTLIELLVVIAIIALLMSILMPAMSKVNKATKAVVCRANLRHWGLIWEQYTDMNEGYFTESLYWVNPLRDFYKDGSIRLCPRATKPYLDERGYRTGANHPFAAAGIWHGSNWGQQYDHDSWSYGMNGWLCNPGLGEGSGGGRENEYLWRTPNIKNAHEVPMFLDCHTYENMTPREEDEPPRYDGDPIVGNEDEMRICCLNRHDGTINGAFVDFSARKIGLKELWNLRWYRSYDIHARKPDWPEWMRRFRDYD